jgi:23S rRNA (cytidine1920-2'-O)/16S rRNA (cytidine1409-2'-O)-methyltransferase
LTKSRARLDVMLVERGLAPSRERARALILAGSVSVDGQRTAKAGALVPLDARVELDAPDHPYVGRGGIKLAHALDVFAIDVTDRLGLDIGASTGGFTDVLLQRNARRVIAVDVGHNQLDWRLRTDLRVEVHEGVNARALTRDIVAKRVDIVTIDVAFISLRHIFPVLPPLLAPAADIVALVKPQFEAGRAQVGKGGLVLDPEVHEAVIQDVTNAAVLSGLTRIAMTPSPITGATGNREFFLHLRETPAPVETAPADESAGGQLG